MNDLAKNDLLKNIFFAENFAGNYDIDNKRNIEKMILDLHSYADIKRIGEKSPLYKWIPAIVFTLFDFNTYETCDLNEDSSSTFMVISPLSSHYLDYIEPLISSNRYTIKKFEYVYTKKLVTKLYGGFPWFKYHVKYVTEFNLWGRKSNTFLINKIDGSDCLRELIRYKNKFRKNHPWMIYQKEFNNGFKGIIYPFHTPNPIENKCHCMAIREAIINKVNEECR